MADEDTDTGGNTPPEGEPSAAGNEPAETQQPAGEQKFSQAEVDRIVKQRAERIAAQKYGDYDDLKSKATKYDELEQANKSELERATNDRDSHKSRADKAEAAARRFEVAFASAPEHVTPAQIKAVAKRVTGDTDEDLESDAAELFELLAPKPAEEPETPRVSSRPTERMPRGGGDPDEPPMEMDPRKLADMIPRAR